jgi:hypothetical protein
LAAPILKLSPVERAFKKLRFLIVVVGHWMASDIPAGPVAQVLVRGIPAVVVGYWKGPKGLGPEGRGPEEEALRGEALRDKTHLLPVSWVFPVPLKYRPWSYGTTCLPVWEAPRVIPRNRLWGPLRLRTSPSPKR